MPSATHKRAERGDGLGAMPAKAALIAVLIMERPLCLTCISNKSALTADEVDSYLRKITGRLDVLRTVDRCRACGTSDTVYSLIRRD